MFTQLWFDVKNDHFWKQNLFLFSAQLYISTILASSLTYSASPIFFEFSVEIAYPVPEGVVGGFLTLVYNTFGMTFLFLFYVPALGKFESLNFENVFIK